MRSNPLPTGRSQLVTLRPVGANAFYSEFSTCQIVYNRYYSCMEYVNYIAIGCSIAAFGLSLIACARVGKFVRATADTDWETLANLTGDIAALKRTSQTLNNRLNGMNKAVVPQDQIIQQMLEHQNVEQIRRGG